MQATTVIKEPNGTFLTLHYPCQVDARSPSHEGYGLNGNRLRYFWGCRFKIVHELGTGICIYVDACFLFTIHVVTGVHFYVHTAFHIRIHFQNCVHIETRNRFPNVERSENRRHVSMRMSISVIFPVWKPAFSFTAKARFRNFSNLETGFQFQCEVRLPESFHFWNRRTQSTGRWLSKNCNFETIIQHLLSTGFGRYLIWKLASEKLSTPVSTPWQSKQRFFKNVRHGWETGFQRSF